DLPVVDVKRNREALREYFTARRNRLDIVKTTRSPSGQVLDWIPIEKQLRRGQKLATPPSESVPLQVGRGRTRLRPVTFELEDPTVSRGPEGTVPIVRRNLGALRGTRSLQEHLAKHGHRTYEMFIDDRNSVEVPADGT